MLDAVRNTLDQFHMVEPHDHVVCGVSGGADSVALLLNLNEYKKFVDFDMEVVHINHMIRDDAKEDANFVVDLCKTLNVKCTVVEVDVLSLAKEKGLSTEEAGRIARYEAMKALNPTKIATGHHRDDIVETVLLNMCRGSGLHGICGIEPVSGNVIRPLFQVSRKEIEEYLKSKNQPYQTDSTNLSNDYTRNRFRNKVIPYLEEEINEQTVSHIANLANDMSKLEKYIEKETAAAFETICKSEGSQIVVDITLFKELDDYIKGELILSILSKLTSGRKDITRTHVRNIMDIAGLEGWKQIDLPYNLQAVKSYDNLIIRHKENDEKRKLDIIIDYASFEENKEYTYELGDGRRAVLKAFWLNNESVIPNNKYTKWVDYDKIKCSLVLRNRQEKDYLTISDTMQKKSLKDYMINEKIPKETRDQLALFADDSHIIWMIDYRISTYYKITNETKRVLEIKVI